MTTVVFVTPDSEDTYEMSNVPPIGALVRLVDRNADSYSARVVDARWSPLHDRVMLTCSRVDEVGA